MTSQDSFEVKLSLFEGPFDLLLFFIERDELDIYDIPISKITNDFLDYIHQMERLNIEALNALVAQHNVKLMTFPADLVQAAAKESTDVLAQLATRGANSRKVHDSYLAFRDKVSPWSKISLRAVLEARG